METKWYITFNMEDVEWEEFEQYMQLIEDNLQTSCALAGVEITDFEQK